MPMKDPNGGTRHLFVDDSDHERINYIGDWTQGYGPGHTIGTHGQAFNDTTHLTNVTSGASLSFTFEGSAVAVYGSIRNDKNSTALHNWECYADGTTMFGSTRYTNVSQSNEVLCEWDTVPKDGPHTISLNVTSSGADFFRFDYIKYHPTYEEDFVNAAIQIMQSDPSVVREYGFEIGHSGKNVLIANASSAKLVFDFTGTSTTVFGRTLKSSPNISSPLWYIIDDDAPKNFTVPMNFDYDMTGRQFFTTPIKRQGPHCLQIFYSGDSQKAPLLIDSFAVFNGSKVHSGQSLALVTSNVSNLPTPSATSRGQGINLPASIGGLVGGGVFIVLFTLVMLLLWRRGCRRKSTASSASLGGPPLHPSVSPFSMQVGNVGMRISARPKGSPPSYYQVMYEGLRSRFRPI